ncbi:hypothetical protein [Staphylococcus argenteus]|uniref:hypothetical protein n=1 Tax=Staphylococcus argenteus TaxID=985002 RepID=UPI001EFE7C9C|nr:hypothetical protein [Staphylococcus argenteus]MCG9804392.1 hypothetical protein [Staphylococcus argenteus]MCG9810428.1 hypothetical protein [Staphylococcus argenteus]MCG9825053.1 hypothetical protein [Staphylococcus argenteus]
MSMDLIIGKIAIWIGIVAQICYNVAIVSVTAFIFYIYGEVPSPVMAVLIALVIIAIISLPLVLTAINLENKMEVKGALFIVYAIVVFRLHNYLSSILWVVCGIFLIWAKYSKGESTDEDENKNVDSESTENRIESTDNITKK